jgi:hypothetical protein
MISRKWRRTAGGDRAVEAVSWVEREIAACEFEDVRLGKRFRDLLEQIGGAVWKHSPMACQDWANAKAAYRFFSNGRLSEEVGPCSSELRPLCDERSPHPGVAPCT